MRLVCGGLLPVLPALILRLIRDRRAREICAVIFTFLVSGAVGYALLTAGDGRTELFRLSDDFVCVLRMDGAGKVYIGLAALLWPFATLYAVESMRREPREGNFFSWFLLAYSPAVFLAAAGNLFTLYIFYEFLTLCTVPLVWHRRDEESTKAALTYMLYLIGGAAIGFMAVALLPSFLLWTDGMFHAGGCLSFRSYIDAGEHWIALLGFVGFGVKAAALPFCRWLPKASVAPTPVTALLHAVAVVNAGVFAVMRVLFYTVRVCTAYDSSGTWVRPAALILSAATILYAAVMAVREQQVKKRLAWSTVSNLSYMLFGLSLMTGGGVQAGLAHMIFHSFAKIILFFCAGAVIAKTGRTQVRQMHGLGRKMPFTFGVFTLAGLSLAGVPPLPGFVSKYALVTAAFEAGDALAVAGAAVLAAAWVLTVMYIFQIIIPAFFMRYHEEPGETLPRDPGPCMKLSLAALSLVLLAAGVLADPILRYLQTLTGGAIG